ncbi:hypothetical protein [Nocardia sp. NPDC057440]|uniref:hypothetical protein n=1 Tax=Nocardia sp. NPDC057440 TaxID=3346134 RepID=UPI00366E50FC
MNMLIVGAVVLALGLLIMLTAVLSRTRSPRNPLTVADLQARLAEEAAELIGNPPDTPRRPSSADGRAPRQDE